MNLARRRIQWVVSLPRPNAYSSPHSSRWFNAFQLPSNNTSTAKSYYKRASIFSSLSVRIAYCPSLWFFQLPNGMFCCGLPSRPSLLVLEQSRSAVALASTTTAALTFTWVTSSSIRRLHLESVQTSAKTMSAVEAFVTRTTQMRIRNTVSSFPTGCKHSFISLLNGNLIHCPRESYFIEDGEQPYYYFDVDCAFPPFGVTQISYETSTTTVAATTYTKTLATTTTEQIATTQTRSFSFTQTQVVTSVRLTTLYVTSSTRATTTSTSYSFSTRTSTFTYRITAPTVTVTLKPTTLTYTSTTRITVPTTTTKIVTSTKTGRG